MLGAHLVVVQNVLLVQNAHMTKHVITKSVLIHALMFVVRMQNVE